MAVYRQVHVEFWQDAFVLDLTPEEKYFYVYLMTNSKTTQCGIYELPKRIIETETGYNRETVEKLLARFIEYKKILYSESTREIMLLNWAKFNFINSPKVKKCIEKELEKVKNKQFLREYHSILQRFGYRIDTLSKDYGEEKEKEKEKEEELASASDFYQKNFGFLSGFIMQDVTKWEEDLGSEMVIEAMKRALSANKSTWNYVKAILIDWTKHNLTNIAEVEAYELQRKHNTKQPASTGAYREMSKEDMIFG